VNLRHLFASAASVAATTLLATALTGCTVGPNYHPPATADLPDAFTTAPSATTRPTTAVAATEPAPDLTHWWTSLNDPLLDSFVQRAAQSNLDLQIAAQRLQEARAAEMAITGSGIPGLGTTPGIDISGAAGRTSGNNATKGRIAAPLNAASDTAGLKEITELVGFDAAWELDFFGRYRRVLESVGADTQAAAEARNAALISLVADVVRTYVDVRSYQFRLDIARQNVAVQKRTLDLVRLRFQRGLTNELDVALAERQYPTSLSRIAPLEAAAAAAERRLAVLLGEFPDALHNELANSAPLPAPPPGVAPGMPVELLRRRPDVRQAERQLASATARIGVATADLFPRVVMTGGVGWQQQDLGRSPVLGKFVYSVGPSMYWPFLDFGRLDAAVQAQDIHARQLSLVYRKTVITAVQEVDDALNNYAAEQTHLSQLGEAVTASKRAANIASQRYTNGLTDFINVLDAQRQLFDLEDQYALAQESMIWQFVALYKALGGGWQGFEAPAPPRAPLPAILAAPKALAHSSSDTTQPPTAANSQTPQATP
jgi:NodT family efflux transporter outer membrane factor (OMF) lipoprotein